MWKLHNKRINLAFLINPFYMYCLSFSMVIFVYQWGWSKIFPKLSLDLLLFFAGTFILFIFTGNKFGKISYTHSKNSMSSQKIMDIIFCLIILLGLVNVFYMGYLPVLDRSRDYREFGMPVVDPVFNTLCIFFSLSYFQLFLEKKTKRFLIYVSVILIIQILLFRRSTLVWIITSSFFLFLIYRQKISLIVLLACLICIPLLSYLFGVYGNTRSRLTKSIVLYDLGASETFKKSGISYNHYITYLYVSSPLANLQENINKNEGFFNKKDIKDFIFYCMVPGSITKRLEKKLEINPPVCELITPELIVGTIFMVSFFTLGWPGMFAMIIFLFVIIFLCLMIINKWNTFSMATYSILSTTVSLSVFSDFLDRLDVIIMLFVYPILFHMIFTRYRSKVVLNR